MINIVELLKDVQQDIELYSPLCGKCKLSSIVGNDTIRVLTYQNIPFRFDEYGRFFSANDAECLLFPGKNCTWEGWKATIEPKFEVGDWIANDGCLGTYLITDVNDGYYGCESPVGERVTFTFNHVHKDFHLWTIADAKGGDVICTTNNNLFIYKCKGVGVQIYDYCGFYHGKFEPDSSSPNGVYNSCDGYAPATKDHRDLLFKKMTEAGYEWDSEKKELRKIIEAQFKVGDDIKTGNTIETIAEIDYATRSYCCESGRTIWFENQDMWHLAPKPHYDISNFKAGMPVLVRETNLNAWQYVLFSHCYTGGDGLTRFNAGLVGFTQCIPFNKDTEHLLGTTDPCDERFVNW